MDSIEIEENDSPQITNAKKSINMVKHTETIDKLVIQNKTLQKDLHEAEMDIESLHHRLKDSNIRISKNLFYIMLFVVGYLAYASNNKLTMMNDKIIEMGVIMNEYKNAIERAEIYNRVVSEKLHLHDDTNK